MAPIDRPTVQLFVNARPGRRARRRARALGRALEAAGAEVLISESRSSPLAIDPRADRVCAVGGDGTVRHVVEALHRSKRDLPMGVYPLGTINLLARECGYSLSPRIFAARMLAADTRRHRTALVGSIAMMTCASVGPDSQAVAALSPSLKRGIGRLAYLIAFGRQLVRWRRMPLSMSWASGRLDCEAVYVVKGRFFAGPWSVAPEACVTEPLLHIVALRVATRRRFALFVWTLLRRGRVDRLDGVVCFSCDTLTIDGPEPAPVQVDGDIEAHLPVRISLRAEPTVFF